MYAVELAFSDDPARLEARPAHRDRMAALKEEGRVLAGGPWADESGALVVFLVDSREEVDALIEADPYYRAPGVTVVSVREWNAVTRHRLIEDL